MNNQRDWLLPTILGAGAGIGALILFSRSRAPGHAGHALVRSTPKATQGKKKKKKSFGSRLTRLGSRLVGAGALLDGEEALLTTAPPYSVGFPSTSMPSGRYTNPTRMSIAAGGEELDRDANAAACCPRCSTSARLRAFSRGAYGVDEIIAGSEVKLRNFEGRNPWLD